MKNTVLIICIFLCLLFAAVIYFNFKLQRQKKQFEKERKKNEEQTRKNTKAKESMESGSARADFDASLAILSKLKK